jgi:hypothetical protein
MNTRNTSHLDWVLEHMPDESARALGTFTHINQHWRGAHWDDCLDRIMDADGHLEVTEPLCEAAREAIIASGYSKTYPAALTSAVGITLLYASQAFAEATPDEQWIMVEATITNNGGGL